MGGCDMLQASTSTTGSVIDVEDPHAAQKLAYPRGKTSVPALGRPERVPRP